MARASLPSGRTTHTQLLLVKVFASISFSREPNSKVTLSRDLQAAKQFAPSVSTLLGTTIDFNPEL
jgi:hypothetical protein